MRPAKAAPWPRRSAGVTLAVLILCARPAAAAVLVEDDFTDGISAHWVPWTADTGRVTLENGAARFSVLGTSSACCYSNAEISDLGGAVTLPWQFVNTDFRLRASNTNRYGGGTGAGSRGWGFWTGTFGSLGGQEGAANWLWFISLSPESAFPFPGYWASAVTNDTIGRLADVGSDMTEWHDYRIVWREDGAELYVDGEFLTEEPRPPTVPMGLVFWIDNYRVTWNGHLYEVGFLDLPEDQFVELDWVRVYTSRARFTHPRGEEGEAYTVDADVVTVAVDDPDENLDRAQPERVEATVSDPESGDSETVVLTETTPASGRFLSAPLPTSDGEGLPGNGILETGAGHTIALEYADANDARDRDGDTATIVAVPACHGDCGGGGTVEVSELIGALRIALGLAGPWNCRAIDTDRNDTVTVDELVAAIHAALHGCPPAPAGELIGHEGCKSWQPIAPKAMSADQDCVEWRYAGGTLLLDHVNAGFNCCPGEIRAGFTIASDKLRIEESSTEEGCRCLCLYDLAYAVRNLAPGDTTLSIGEPHLTGNDQRLVATVTLAEGVSGAFCARRDHYPW